MSLKCVRKGSMSWAVPKWGPNVRWGFRVSLSLQNFQNLLLQKELTGVRIEAIIFNNALHPKKRPNVENQITHFYLCLASKCATAINLRTKISKEVILTKLNAMHIATCCRTLASSTHVWWIVIILRIPFQQMICSINFFIFLQKKIFLRNTIFLRILAFPKII